MLGSVLFEFASAELISLAALLIIAFPPADGNADKSKVRFALAAIGRARTGAAFVWSI